MFPGTKLSSIEDSYSFVSFCKIIFLTYFVLYNNNSFYRKQCKLIAFSQYKLKLSQNALISVNISKFRIKKWCLRKNKICLLFMKIFFNFANTDGQPEIRWAFEHQYKKFVRRINISAASLIFDFNLFVLVIEVIQSVYFRNFIVS